MAVYLTRPPHNVRLVGWGRADDGWWGWITWQQRLISGGVARQVDFAAWVPAAALTQPQWSSTVALPRVQLPPDRRRWPAPSGWPSWYAGVWADGPVMAPPGMEIDDRPAWRRR